MIPQLPPSSLDNLAANGVIDFDADAFIRGTTPRYVGGDKTYLPFETPLPQSIKGLNTSNLKGQPDSDVFNDGKKKLPLWKKITAGVAGTLLLAFGGFKIFKHFKK